MEDIDLKTKIFMILTLLNFTILISCSTSVYIPQSEIKTKPEALKTLHHL